MKIKEYFSIISRHWPFNYYRTIHSIKTAIACLIGVIIEKHYNLPSGQWIPITIMVVMSAQTHFGGALRKAYMRFLGTVSGVAITTMILLFFGNSLTIILCAVFIVCIIFTYVASSNGDISYAGTLGGVTVLLTLTGQQVGIEMAAQRGLYIVIGIAIALFVSRIIFPIHARDRFRYHVAITLRNLQKLYHKTVRLSIEPGQKAVDAELEDIVAADITDQPRLINEAVIGSLVFAAKRVFFTEIINSEHQLNRLINLTYRSLCEIETPALIKEHLSVVEDLHTIIGDSLNYLADCFENSKQPQAMAGLSEARNKISQLVEKLPKNDKAYKTITGYSFVFFMEQILKELENMKQLIIKVNSKNNDNMI
ncbi:MAG: putative membrane spanning protein [uncultured bacterium]|nr:MAG: putative membrane spanning protein [uncultured bacterium]